jgi:hypothetical protein
VFKRGDVVQHNRDKRIGVVASYNSLAVDLFQQWIGSIIWFDAGMTDGKDYSDVDLTKIDGYEFEAVIALGDNAKALELYNKMKRQRDLAIAATVPALHRRYTFTLKLGADSVADIDSALNSIQYDLVALTDKQPLESDYHAVSGSPTAGWTIDIQFDPDMTHERYFEMIEEWRKQKNGA